VRELSSQTQPRRVFSVWKTCSGVTSSCSVQRWWSREFQQCLNGLAVLNRANDCEIEIAGAKEIAGHPTQIFGGYSFDLADDLLRVVNLSVTEQVLADPHHLVGRAFEGSASSGRLRNLWHDEVPIRRVDAARSSHLCDHQPNRFRKLLSVESREMMNAPASAKYEVEVWTEYARPCFRE